MAHQLVRPAFFDYRPDVRTPETYADTLLSFTRHKEFKFNTVLWDMDGACLRILMSDPIAKDLPAKSRIAQGKIRKNPYRDDYWNQPPTKATVEELETRCNNSRLLELEIHSGWIVYPVEGKQITTGKNLVSLRLSDHFEEISVERIELSLRYSD
ncbi:TPA: hypothetical protein EYN98_06070 [Candidatus Poribacteria bacterium]|nr:hypothetical protein [Candidatus Poribacteria bacterium]HIA65622.1 hypothetical protein [Candidatus Poribacteria bacterium]HIC03754.1 hypothetical protein [Candidatus Poribacteria bacterium]HIN28679.1 hypothetical protein [Candidatus Poribacteria bacterium]HIO79080.1 hypothetical protein [Candidatus Poribacteria bacterium]